MRLLKPGREAPVFRLLDHAGNSVGLSDAMLYNGVVLLFFSSNWLGADLRLLKACMAAYPAFQEAGLGVLGMTGVNWEKIHHLAHRLETPFPLLFDPCCRFSSRYGAMWIPRLVTGRAVYIVNSAGRIALARKAARPEVIATLLE